VLAGEDVSDMETLPLLRVVACDRRESGKPRQDPEFVPPSLLLRSSPVLHDMMRELVGPIEREPGAGPDQGLHGGLGVEVKAE